MQEGEDLVQRRRLSTVHAAALYRPFPPVDLDDDGFICRDRRVSESTCHGELREYVFGAARSLLAHLPDAWSRRIWRFCSSGTIPGRSYPPS